MADYIGAGRALSTIEVAQLFSARQVAMHFAALQLAEKLTSHTAVPSVAEATVGFAILTARLEAAPFQNSVPGVVFQQLLGTDTEDCAGSVGSTEDGDSEENVVLQDHFALRIGTVGRRAPKKVKRS